MLDLIASTIICTGVAATTPVTNIEIEVQEKRSTIRYEIAEGSLAGTAYIQSLGKLSARRIGRIIELYSDPGLQTAVLVMITSDEGIVESYFYHYSSNSHKVPVDCQLQYN